MPNLDTKKVFSLNISVGSYKEILNSIVELSQKEKSSYVCVANVHMTVESVLDDNFAKVVNGSNITTADGMPIVQFLKRLRKTPSIERCAGMDMMPDLLKRCEEDNLSVYFYGGTQEVLEAVLNKTNADYPNLKIAGTFSPPFVKDVSFDEEKTTEINESNADFVFVSLGCPKQEKWMALHKDKVNSCMIGLGGAFLVYSGTIPRAPKIMSNLSLEWLYRLIKEPKRLWKRYLITNTVFLYMTAIEIIKLPFKRN